MKIMCAVASAERCYDATPVGVSVALPTTPRSRSAGPDRRRLPLLLFVARTSLGPCASAAGHAGLVEATWQPGTRLEAARRVVTVAFTEPLVKRLRLRDMTPRRQPQDALEAIA